MGVFLACVPASGATALSGWGAKDAPGDFGPRTGGVHRKAGPTGSALTPKPRAAGPRFQLFSGGRLRLSHWATRSPSSSAFRSSSFSNTDSRARSRLWSARHLLCC